MTTKPKANTTASTDVKPEPLHAKYRPREWGHVVGQEAAVKSMRRLVREKKSQAYLLTGPSGTGKTTLARIAAVEWGCAPQGITDLDAATHSGIDHVRSILDVARSQPWGDKTGRAMIIDEAHRLSAQSWDALLKSIEEPPEHTVWFICTTNPSKVPVTVKTRCSPIQLKTINEKRLAELADEVIDLEKGDMPAEVQDVCVAEAQGSARQLLVNVETCWLAETRKEALSLLQGAVMNDATLELCRFLMRPGSWTKLMAIVKRIEGDSYEGVRIVVANYFGAVAKNAKSDRDAMRALDVLDFFATPYNQAEGIAPLLLSCGRILFRPE